MLNLSGTNVLLFLQLLVILITRSAVNVCAIYNGFLLVSPITNGLFLKEVCLPNFEMLNLMASCLDDENEISLKAISLFSALHFALPSIPFIVLHSLVRSVFWSMVSTKSLNLFSLYTQMRFWVAWQFRRDVVSFAEVISPGHRVQYLCSWSMWHPVGMWCDAALRIVRKAYKFPVCVGKNPEPLSLLTPPDSS